MKYKINAEYGVVATQYYISNYKANVNKKVSHYTIPLHTSHYFILYTFHLRALYKQEINEHLKFTVQKC